MALFDKSEVLSAIQCARVIRSIGSGEHCLACGAVWSIDGSGQRRMSHDHECLYTASVDLYDFGTVGLVG